MLSPRNVLITGANRGLGLELVKQFLKLPTPPQTLLATCRNPEEAKDLNEVASNHSNVKVLKLDVTDTKSVEGIGQLVKPHIEAEGLNLLINNAGVNIRHGIDTANRDNMLTSFEINVVGSLNTVQVNVTNPVDIEETICKSAESISKEGLNLLVNNAGIAYKKQYLGNLTKQALTEQFDINVFGPILVTQALLPYLKQAAKLSKDTGLNCNRAAIVNMSTILSSIAANETGGLYPYRTSKAALNMLTKTLNVDLKPEGILCFCLHPGWVQTDMGGPNAPVVKGTSIAGLLNVMSQMNENSDIFKDYTGKTMEW